MNKILRRALPLLLLFALLLTLAPAPIARSEAASSGACGKDGDNLTWAMDGNGVLTISGEGEMQDFTEDDPAPWGRAVIRVAVEEGVVSIGERAFYSCESLESVSLPESLTSIGEFAFYRCSSLASVSLPESLAAIGDYAFSGCTSLESVSLPESLASIGEGAFSRCESLTSVSLPEGLTAIGKNAFFGCSASLLLTVEPDSYAEQYCIDNELSYTLTTALDWLKD